MTVTNHKPSNAHEYSLQKPHCSYSGDRWRQLASWFVFVIWFLLLLFFSRQVFKALFYFTCVCLIRISSLKKSRISCLISDNSIKGQLSFHLAYSFFSTQMLITNKKKQLCRKWKAIHHLAFITVRWFFFV